MAFEQLTGALAGQLQQRMYQATPLGQQEIIGRQLQNRLAAAQMEHMFPLQVQQMQKQVEFMISPQQEKELAIEQARGISDIQQAREEAGLQLQARLGRERMVEAAELAGVEREDIQAFEMERLGRAAGLEVGRMERAADIESKLMGERYDYQERLAELGGGQAIEQIEARGDVESKLQKERGGIQTELLEREQAFQEKMTDITQGHRIELQNIAGEQAIDEIKIRETIERGLRTQRHYQLQDEMRLQHRLEKDILSLQSSDKFKLSNQEFNQSLALMGYDYNRREHLLKTKAKAAQEAMGDAVPFKYTKEGTEMTMKYLKQAESFSDSYQTVQDNMVNIESAVNRMLEITPEQRSRIATDQIVIMSLNKILDPDSVVRESEFKRTPGSEPIRNRFKAIFTKFQKGGVGLTDESIIELRDAARDLAELRRTIINNKLELQIREPARKRKLDPEEIAPLFSPVSNYFNKAKAPAITPERAIGPPQREMGAGFIGPIEEGDVYGREITPTEITPVTGGRTPADDYLDGIGY